MTKQQKIQDLTTQLAEVTAKLVLVERKLDDAEQAKVKAINARRKAEDQYRDLKSVMQAVLDYSPKPEPKGYFEWNGAIKIAPPAAVMNIPTLKR